MKSLRLDRWASQLHHPPRNPRLHLLAQRHPYSTSKASPQPRQSRRHPCKSQWQAQTRHLSRTSQCGAMRASELVEEPQSLEEEIQTQEETQTLENTQSRDIDSTDEPNFPLHNLMKTSGKLAALHARLSLPAKFPIQTLARCLIDPSADSRPSYNNASLALLGQELMGYYTSEDLICHYPRLPLSVLYAAQYAYVGPATLGAIRREWGVEMVAAPGPEVDPGLLQLKRMTPGNAMAADGTRLVKDLPQSRKPNSNRKDNWNYRRGMSSRVVYDDQFGDLNIVLQRPETTAPFVGAPISTSGSSAADTESAAADDMHSNETSSQPTVSLPSDETSPVTVEAASAGFVRAVIGALYLHAGRQAAKDFHKAHIASRKLELHKLFNFKYPTRDLATLCKREGYEPPVARIISETGRLSRTPVFIIGVFSGKEKLGEAEGASLNEGRVRAAAAALRAWYLYRPMDNDIVLPSEVEGFTPKKSWKPQYIDPGEIIT